jgi:hypothetical protein
MTATITNPATGVEYYADGQLEGQSVKLYVPVANDEILNSRGVRWPILFGQVHDQPAEYYEVVPFTPIPFDPEIRRVDEETSGLQLRPTRNQLGELVDVPNGHPKGTCVRVENTIRRSKAELRQLVKGYAARAHGELWPQEPGYDQKVAFAKEEIAKGSEAQYLYDLVNRNAILVAASFANDARLAMLYAMIENAGETGPINLNPGEGWINGIEP